jgi:hypothetical protein
VTSSSHTTSALIAIAVALAAAACGSKTKEFEVDVSVVAIGADKAQVRHGEVGYDEFETNATYVLVDVENNHDKDLVVGIGGELLDANGKVVAKLRKEAMRVPTGGLRMYAPVAEKNGHHPDAVSARMHVTSTLVPSYQRMVVVEEGRAYIDNKRAVVDGWVTNTGEAKVIVIVVAAFWDANGIPMSRPHTIMEIHEGKKSPASFVGPDGSAKGMIFAGDMRY